MIRRILLAAAAAICLAQPVAAFAQDVPAKAIGRAAFAPLEAWAGKTWRGTGKGPAGGAPINDVQQWQWDLGGHAIRITHSVNNGAYAGESVLFPAEDGNGYVYTYVTTGGFYTTGVIHPDGPNAYVAEETVHGVPGLGKLRARGEIGADGVYRTRSSMEKDGQWIEVGGFEYVEDATAKPVLPELPPKQ
ncbi:hypothetical protein ABAC460_16245 [Asticcacaulis sp. AC460]|uniref:hypothetical protein n=1 Tax=Asticcacaulis sp. AC460 TaxID=1282360 RepID=UPI0003C4080A|nr:hypothetical protein [Asticcacaulis sp. AC460]ESQ88211.1 hypothetical protein ABAC460_16245 [Asticcacaulis sp. AC460]